MEPIDDIKPQPLRAVFPDAGFKGGSVDIDAGQALRLSSPSTEATCIRGA